MNLTTKVLLTLALVISAALLTMSLVVGRSADSAYRGYVQETRRRQMEEIALQAALIYADAGSWQAVQEWLGQIPQETQAGGMGPPPEAGRGRGQGPRHGMAGQWGTGALIVVEAGTGAPLAADLPPVPASQLDEGVNIVVDGTPQATLINTAPLGTIGPTEQAVLDQVNRAIRLSAVVAGGVALLLGALLVASILRPLRELESGVSQVARGNLSTRVRIRQRDEIGQLAGSFNSMAASLQQQEELRQRMVADIAHELRTPLSVIQGNLQAILDGVYPLDLAEVRSIYDETGLLSRLVSDLHELAQAEAGRLPLEQMSLPVDEVLRQLVTNFRSLADAREVSLRMGHATAGLTVRADPDRLQQILHNLLGNAIRHTPARGDVTLEAAARPGARVQIRIHNSGPPIPPEILPHIFDRFYRVDSSRQRERVWAPDGQNEASLDAEQAADGEAFTSGAGLGLAIVKALVEAHGGAINATSSPTQGTTFQVELPRGEEEG